MENQKTKYQPWTKEEMALLAHLMGVAFNAGKNQSEAAEFASQKLGRSKLACLGQYQSKMRGKSLSIWSLLPEPGEPEWEVETPADLGSDTDIDKEPNYEEKPSFVDDLKQKMINGDAFMSMYEYKPAKEPVKITVHDSDMTIEPDILIEKDNVIVAKFDGYVITIEL